MADLLLDMSYSFEETQTDLSKCFGCSDVIYGQMFSAICTTVIDKCNARVSPLVLDGKEIKLCQSCHDLIK